MTENILFILIMKWYFMESSSRREEGVSGFLSSESSVNGTEWWHEDGEEELD